jgi:tripartite-type tricarboxylate transporter receptor subunit TctC
MPKRFAVPERWIRSVLRGESAGAIAKKCIGVDTAALSDEKIRKFLNDQAQEPADATIEQYAKLLREDYEKYARLVKELNLKVE